MADERTPTLHCPRCADTRIQRFVETSRVAYTCEACAHQWDDLRQAGAAATADDDLHAAVADICETSDASDTMRVTRSAARRLTHADGVTFVLRAGDMCYYAEEEAIAPLWKGRRFPIASCVSGLAMTERVSIVIPDIYQDARVPHEAYRPTFVQSMLMVPVRKDDPIAAIGVYWQRTNIPTLEHVAIVEMLADAAGLALSSGQQGARLRALTQT